MKKNEYIKILQKELNKDAIDRILKEILEEKLKSNPNISHIRTLQRELDELYNNQNKTNNYE